VSWSNGKIMVEEAYARGKMLDNSGWRTVCPRGITPSDIDLVFDDKQSGRVIFGELSNGCKFWRDLPFGQRQLYSTRVVKGCGDTVAALLTHNVTSGQIDTMRDIQTFQLMIYAAMFGYATTSLIQGDKFPVYVDLFYRNEEHFFVNEHR